MENEVIENIEATETPNVEVAQNEQQQRKGKFNKNGKKPFDRKRRDDRKPRDEFEKRTVLINRVSKSVRGGKILNFSALVVVGDKNGRVGVGSGKSRETTEAIERATKNAKKNLVNVSIVGTTIPHATQGVFGKSKVLLFPSKEGNGIIAGGSVRLVLELAGIENILSKSLGSKSPLNAANATIEALKSLTPFSEVAKRRGLTMSQLLN